MGNGCASIRSVIIKDNLSLHTQEVKTAGLLKIVLVGDNFVGKSAIVQRFVNDGVFEEYQPTSDIEITSVLHHNAKHGKVRLQLWEVPGHESVDVRKSYYADADAAIVVVDVSDEELRFESGERWRRDIASNYCITNTSQEVVTDQRGQETLKIKSMLKKTPASHLPVLLLGNKLDKIKEKERRDTSTFDSETERKTGKVLIEVSNAENILQDDGSKRKTSTTVDHYPKSLDENKLVIGKEQFEDKVGTDKRQQTAQQKQGNEKVEKSKENVKKQVETMKESKLMEVLLAKGTNKPASGGDDSEKKLIEFVNEFDRFASNNFFISGILVSAESSQGGVVEAITSLIRCALDEKHNAWSTMTSYVASSIDDEGSTINWELYQLQEVGVEEVDEIIRRTIPLVEEAELLTSNLNNSLSAFKQLCGDNDDKHQPKNFESCIEWMKNRVCSLPLDVADKGKRNHKETSTTYDEDSYRLVVEMCDEFVDLQVVATSGRFLDHANGDKGVIAALSYYRSEVWPACNQVMRESSRVQTSLSRLNQQLKIKQQTFWERCVSASCHPSQVRNMMTSLSRDRARISGLVMQLVETRDHVTALRARIRASVLF